MLAMGDGSNPLGNDPDGNFQLLRIEAIEGDQVRVNMNHSLAGMALIISSACTTAMTCGPWISTKTKKWSTDR